MAPQLTSYSSLIAFSTANKECCSSCAMLLWTCSAPPTAYRAHTVACPVLSAAALLCCVVLCLQARFPERQYRMVVSMSLGAPGPLTIEQLFFR